MEGRVGYLATGVNNLHGSFGWRWEVVWGWEGLKEVGGLLKWGGVWRVGDGWLRKLLKLIGRRVVDLN